MKGWMGGGRERGGGGGAELTRTFQVEYVHVFRVVRYDGGPATEAAAACD